MTDGTQRRMNGIGTKVHAIFKVRRAVTGPRLGKAYCHCKGRNSASTAGLRKLGGGGVEINDRQTNVRTSGLIEPVRFFVAQEEADAHCPPSEAPGFSQERPP